MKNMFKSINEERRALSHPVYKYIGYAAFDFYLFQTVNQNYSNEK